MATNPVNLNALAGTQNGSSRVPKQELGKDEFLQILAVQLANQDPLEPMKDTDFIAQMAQFSSLEQMKGLNDSFSSTKAYGMIGKSVTATVTLETGEKAEIMGIVSGVVRYNNTDYLQIGEYLVLPSAVSEVYDNTTKYDSMISQAANMIGKQIEATVPSAEDPAKTEDISGEVEYVLVKQGSLFVKLKDSVSESGVTQVGKEVPVSYITKIK